MALGVWFLMREILCSKGTLAIIRDIFGVTAEGGRGTMVSSGVEARSAAKHPYFAQDSSTPPHPPIQPKILMVPRLRDSALGLLYKMNVINFFIT